MRPLPLLILLLLTAWTVGCAAESPTGPAKSVEVLAAFGERADLPPEIAYIALAVTGEGMDTIRRTIDVADLEPDEDVVFRLQVSPGKRTFSVACYNDANFGLYRGEYVTTLQPKQNVQFEIDMVAYGLVRGAVFTFADNSLTPLPDYNQDDIVVADGHYRLEARAGTVQIELAPGDLVAPGQDLWGFNIALLAAAGAEAQADVVLVDRHASDFAARPWVTGAYPHVGLAAGQRIDLYGAGFDLAAAPAVWFATTQPGGTGGLEVEVVAEDNLLVTVPADAPSGGDIYVCLNGTEGCSNPFPFGVAP